MNTRVFKSKEALPAKRLGLLWCQNPYQLLHPPEVGSLIRFFGDCPAMIAVDIFDERIDGVKYSSSAQTPQDLKIKVIVEIVNRQCPQSIIPLALVVQRVEP